MDGECCIGGGLVHALMRGSADPAARRRCIKVERIESVSVADEERKNGCKRDH